MDYAYRHLSISPIGQMVFPCTYHLAVTFDYIICNVYIISHGWWRPLSTNTAAVPPECVSLVCNACYRQLGCSKFIDKISCNTIVVSGSRGNGGCRLCEKITIPKIVLGMCNIVPIFYICLDINKKNKRLIVIKTYVSIMVFVTIYVKSYSSNVTDIQGSKECPSLVINRNEQLRWHSIINEMHNDNIMISWYKHHHHHGKKYPKYTNTRRRIKSILTGLCEYIVSAGAISA